METTETSADVSTPVHKKRGRPARPPVTVSADDESLRQQLAVLAAQVQLLTLEKAQSGGISADQLKEVMAGLIQMQAAAQQAALREIAERDMRDDINYPRISVFSYPEGDRARPRPPFKCAMYWNGYDCDWDTTTATELELLNRFEPGIFTFRRIDGRTPETLTVTGEQNAAGALTKLHFQFPAKDQRDTLPSMALMLRQALGLKTADQERIAALEAQIAALSQHATAAA